VNQLSQARKRTATKSKHRRTCAQLRKAWDLNARGWGFSLSIKVSKQMKPGAPLLAGFARSGDVDFPRK
jgi:hypothetical protein